MLLDTNIVIALMNQEPAAAAQAATVSSLYIPVTVMGELCFGAEKSSRPAENLARLDQFVRSVAVLPCELSTAHLYGSIKQSLRRKGQPIPDNDVWIATIAREHDLVLVTRNAHISSIDGLES